MLISLLKCGALVSVLVSQVNQVPVVAEPQVITEPTMQSIAVQRGSSATLPAKLALVSDERLWMMDARDASAQPVPVTPQGVDEMIGWSLDGQWFAFLFEPQSGPEHRKYLHLVNSDGSQLVEVDPQSVNSRPAWSPVDNRIIYQSAADGEHTEESAKMVTVADDGSLQYEVLLPAGDKVVEMAWAPDGKQIAISQPRTEEKPLQIGLLSLDGKLRDLYTDASPVNMDDIYVRQAAGLTWSPNGEYMAFFALPNSASITADGVEIRLLHLATGETTSLGDGLAYPEWFAWSADSSQLAFIGGGGREATINKHLRLFDTHKGELINLSQAGFVDTAPIPLGDDGGFLFVRGQERHWGDLAEPDGLYVPGQRIWQQSMDGAQTVLTEGTADTADYGPLLSPDGKQLLYLRLAAPHKGSIYLKQLAEGTERELIRGISGSPGYYSNYLPQWVVPYWTE
ncbi:hypothetical protein LOK74_09440 [Brevibacillus humidisoli]|uniref:TolB family protein n=1 Tax=Brevibacillus humidisoli TaxID=2895522 RepID=UPI001E3560FD|nr:hypothetical protein [Brevibacillus humidisoli]UFJ42691.1 hypothetical protein LOK74_09440 [Brevibacillus humidisoli]